MKFSLALFIMAIATLLYPSQSAFASGPDFSPNCNVASVANACGAAPPCEIWRAGSDIDDLNSFANIGLNDAAGLDGERCRREVSDTNIGNGIRISIPKGCLVTGWIKSTKIPSTERAFLEYTACFSDNFDFRGEKLPGLAGGRWATGGNYSNSGFSSRAMFDRVSGVDRFEGGAGNNYLYWPDQKEKYGGCPGCRWIDEVVLRPGERHRI